MKCEDVSAVAQVRDREAVAKTMGMNVFHCSAHANFLQQSIERVSIQWPINHCLAVQELRTVGFAGLTKARPQVFIQGFATRLAKVPEALLFVAAGAFAPCGCRKSMSVKMIARSRRRWGGVKQSHCECASCA